MRSSQTPRTGYYRFEILAAAFNALLLFAVGLYILFEAYQRLKNPPEIQSMGMLVIASFGLVVNLISMRLLSSGRESSLNLKGAYLEVWSDSPLWLPWQRELVAPFQAERGGGGDIEAHVILAGVFRGQLLLVVTAFESVRRSHLQWGSD